MDSGDRIEILWEGGVTRGIYADHRDGGRVIVEDADEGPVLMLRSEFGRCKVRGGMGEPWGTDLDLFWDSLYGQGAVDDTTAREEPSDDEIYNGHGMEGGIPYDTPSSEADA